MEEAGGGEVRLSPSRLRDELRRLLSSDPLPARLPPGDGSPQGHRSAVLAGPMPKGEWALGPAAAERRREAGPDLRSHLSFWKRIAGIVIAVAVILLLTWITLRATADWNSSQESCSDYRASLAAIDSRQELNFLMYRIRIPDFWIGLRRKGNKFFWVNGESFDANLNSAKSVGRGGRAPLCTGGVLLPWVLLGSSLTCSGELCLLCSQHVVDCEVQVQMVHLCGDQNSLP
ncbi:uncharacterized protein LJ206_005394 isoform 4-T6 [Theristicus caerulescens]